MNASVRKEPVPRAWPFGLRAADGVRIAGRLRTRRGGDVPDTFYTARSRIKKIQGVHRRARLEDGTEFDMGVHGVIKTHYRLDARDLPLPVDYQVGATGG